MDLKNKFKHKLREVLLLEKENGNYEFGCVMLQVPFEKEVWDNIQSYIPDEVIYEGDEHGREDDQHVTLLYGLHQSNSDEDVINLVKTFNKVQLTLDTVGFFDSSDEYDVIKFELSDKILNKFNKILRDNVEYTSSFPDYKAHCTICYVKSGEGEKYVNILNKELDSFSFNCDKVVYSKPNNEKIKINLYDKN